MIYSVIYKTNHYSDVIMTATTSQITSLTIVYSTVYSDAVQRKHQSSASLAFVRGIHRGPVNSPDKRTVSRKMFPFDDVIMNETTNTKHNNIYRLKPRNMVEIFHKIFSISLKSVPENAMDNKAPLAQLISWRRSCYLNQWWTNSQMHSIIGRFPKFM